MTPEKTLENIQNTLTVEEAAEMRKENLERFINFRDNYINDLPTKKLWPRDANYHLYKCRGNFFIGRASDIEELIKNKIITNPEAIKTGEDYIKYVRNRDFSKFSTQEDLDKVNEIIECVIKELSRNKICRHINYIYGKTTTIY